MKILQLIFAVFLIGCAKQQPKSVMHEWLVSYQFKTTDGNGFGMFHYQRNSEDLNWQAIGWMQNFVMTNTPFENITNVIILNVTRLN